MLATSASSFSTNSFNSASVTRRYNGMIREKTTKKARNLLFRLFDYIGMVAPNMRGLQAFITIWRMIQIFGPAMCVGYRDFWGEDSILLQSVDIISILFHIFPTSDLRKLIAPTFLIAEGIFFLLIIGYIFAAGVYYDKNAQLPRFVPTSIFFIFSTVGYILPPIGMNLIGEQIGYMIQDSSQINGFTIFAIVFVLLVFILFMIIFTIGYAVTINFRSDSLMTVVPTNQSVITVMILLVTFFPACGSKIVSSVTTIILNLLTIVSYVIMLYLFFNKGGFVYLLHLKAAVATVVSGIILILIVTIFILLKMLATEVILVVFVAIWIICFFATNYVFNYITRKSMTLLDGLMSEEISFDSIKSPRTFCDTIVCGFRNAHPFCLSYDVFRPAIEKWPKNYDIWLLFAKFTAIYPEINQQLSFIGISMMQNKMKGGFAKHTMQQISTVLRQRESNLIPELKSKLDNIGRKVQSTKAKIRYLWDLVLQGSVKELEPVILRCYESVNRVNVEFIHLISMFPNNRFVARSYTRFLRDVVADHQAQAEWTQKLNSLQRGLMVHPDISHELGILAFPILPQKLSLSNAPPPSIIPSNTTEDTLLQDVDISDDFEDISFDMKNSIKESIDKLRLPSYQLSRVGFIVLFLILFLIPFIIVAIYTPIYVEENSGSLDYLFALSTLRLHLFEALSLAVHYCGENLELRYDSSHPYRPNQIVLPFGTIRDIQSTFKEGETPGSAWGNSWETKDQLRYVVNYVSTILTELMPIQSYKIGDVSMDEVRQNIFAKSLSFRVFDGPYYGPGFNFDSTDRSLISYNITYTSISVIEASTNFMNYLDQILSYQKVPQDVFCQRPFISILNNLRAVNNAISTAIQSMLTFYNNQNRNIQNLTLYIMVVIIIVVTIIYCVFCGFIVTLMHRDKMQIYKCLTTLQKSVVSRVAEQFRILRKDDTEDRSTKSKDEELSRQEENLLKLFAASSDGGSGNRTLDWTYNIILTIIMIVCHAAMVIYLVSCYRDSVDTLDKVTPQIDHIYAAYTYDHATIFLFHLLIPASHPAIIYESQNYNSSVLLNVIQEWQDRAQNEMAFVQFGDPANNGPPLTSIDIDFDAINAISSCDNTFKPTNFHEVYECLTPEATISFIQLLLNQMTNVFVHTSSHPLPEGNDPFLTQIFHCHMVHVYNEYFEPLFSAVAALIIKTMNSNTTTMNVIIFVLAAILLLLIIVNFLTMTHFEEVQKYGLTLLLHCPPKVVLSNLNASAILSGHFKHHSGDFSLRDYDCTDEIVEEMPDSMIILKIDGTILSVNKSTTRIFDMEKDQLIGQSIEKLGEIFGNDNPFKSMFTNANPEKNEKRALKNHELSFKKSNGQEVFIEMQFVIQPEWHFVISRDITQNIMYNKLIKEEKAKSDALLSSILPPALVPRVAAGEKNISFAVQSASIIFMDIVSFTPWCGSLPAATVMKTLNLLFKDYDRLTNLHPTMTKLKCIGDCYMAAGGLFMDVNQPTAHAKDVVEFGLDSIDAVRQIDERINETLKIRVGINTGGPLVAGVLGTDKPTFEILGPAINMAQQMEHHGVPMKVHVSRAVYELIYGGNFKIQERGEIQIKNGSILTYLVERKA